MPEEYEIELASWGLHVINQPGYQIAKEKIKTKLRHVVETCAQHKVNRVLVDAADSKLNMNIIELYDMVNDLVVWGALGFKFAFFMPQAMDQKEKIFYEAAGKNRSIDIAFFDDKSKAIDWLESSEVDE